MASVQERLQLKRVPLESWTISEQLYLASAVACSGDQNWMSVSRNLKMMCGQNRPDDWFSPKTCASQYEKLLEKTGTTKRKKRSERDTAPQVVETPIEMIVRRLTQDRIAELNKLMQDERDEYNMLKAEIAAVQNDDLSEEQLKEMCLKIEAEEKQREKDKAKYTQWLKDREERKRKLETAARLGSTSTMPQSTPSTPQALKIEEMDIVDDSNTKQATSPLLTSLLKSPSAAPNPSTSMLNALPNQSRVTAPTITNLLTTGAVPNLTGLPQASTSTGIVYSGQIQHQPLSGPVSSDAFSGNITPTPSQAAPTLSMLLENKHKDNATKAGTSSMDGASTSMATKNEQNVGLVTADLNNPDLTIKDEEQQLMDALNDLIPADMDVLAGMILDDLINEEQAAAVSSVAEALEMDAMAEGTSAAAVAAAGSADPIETGVAADLADTQPNNISENACDGMDFDTTADDFLEVQNKSESANSDSKQFISKDDDSSDLSNDTPLSELIKQEASAKQRKLLEDQQLQQLHQQQEQQQQQIEEKEEQQRQQSDELQQQLQLDQKQNEDQPVDPQQHLQEQLDASQFKQDSTELENKQPQEQTIDDPLQSNIDPQKSHQEQNINESTHSDDVDDDGEGIEKVQEQLVDPVHSDPHDDFNDEDPSELKDPLATSNESVDVDSSAGDKSGETVEHETNTSDESHAIEHADDDLEEAEIDAADVQASYPDEYVPVESIAQADGNQSGDDEHVQAADIEQAADPLGFDGNNEENDAKLDETDVKPVTEDEEKDEHMDVGVEDETASHDIDDQENATVDEAKDDTSNVDDAKNDIDDIGKSDDDDIGATSEEPKGDDNEGIDDDANIDDDEQKPAEHDQSNANEMDASKVDEEPVDDRPNDDEILTDDESDVDADDKEENADETADDDKQTDEIVTGNDTTNEIISDERNAGNDRTGGTKSSNDSDDIDEAMEETNEGEEEGEAEETEKIEEDVESESVQETLEPETTPISSDESLNKSASIDDDSPSTKPSKKESTFKSAIPTPEPTSEDVRDESTPKEKQPKTPDIDKESSGDTAEFASVGGGSSGEKRDRTSSERISTDEELFEDAKSTLDSSGERKEKDKAAAADGDGEPQGDSSRIEDISSEISPTVKETDLTASKTSTPTPSILIDTDDDAPIEVIKREGGRKRDYSRRRHDPNQSFDKSIDESIDDSSSAISSRLRMKDRDRSESPFIDDELGEPSNKYKRRYSSTPIPDSLPNSPASSEDREREYRGWKKSIMLIYNTIHNHRFASMFAKPVSLDHAPDYRDIVYNPMDLQTLKRNIDNGVTRTTMEFRRSIMFMCYNAIFYNMHDPVICGRAMKMMDDALEQIDEFNDTWNREKENDKVAASSGSATKTIRGRKSNRLMN